MSTSQQDTVSPLRVKTSRPLPYDGGDNLFTTAIMSDGGNDG